LKKLIQKKGILKMSNSFLHNHQSALDNQREDDAIRDLEDAGIYPDPDDKHYPMETDYEL
jgi:hypothetical protein